MANGEWPIEGATVRLAHNPRAEAIEGERAFHEPPTVDGTIEIGMEATIHMPDLDAQKEGFTPYKLVDGQPVDATRELLAHYSGIYKRVESL